jgi:RimJ/RimL family protein N-acetyltransferase
MTSPEFPQQLALTGHRIALLPMRAQHAEGMLAAASDGELWQSLYTEVPGPKTVDDYIARALTDRDQHGARPFVTILADSGQIVGSTRFTKVDHGNRKCEIGYSWIAKSWQGSFANPEARYLMFRYAFEHMPWLRVQIQADALNLQSRAALRKLGATEEGVVRNDRIMRGGRVRDSAIYSVINTDWPRVRESLEARLVGLGVAPRLELVNTSPD